MLDLRRPRNGTVCATATTGVGGHMELVPLGATDLMVSRICLGCMSYGEPDRGNHSWTLTEAASRPFIDQALDLGINFFDTAELYSDGTSEEIVGRALWARVQRSDVILATKVHPANQRGGLSRAGIHAAIDASLRRLGTDYVDLYQIHRWDYQTPIEETLAALDEIVTAGKVRYLGASSMFAWQFAKSLRLAEIEGWSPFVTMQDCYSLLYREEEREMLPLCADRGIALLPWSPLARGRLARDWDATTLRGETDEVGARLYIEQDRAVVDAVGAVATARGIPRAQVALAWVLANPVVAAPIVGATKAHHLTDAVAALDVELTTDETAALEAPYAPHPVAGFA